MDNKKYSKTKLLIYLLVPVFIGIFMGFLVVENTPLEYWQDIKNSQTAQTIGPVAQITKNKYFYFNRDLGQKPKISAQAYIVGDLNTGEIILSKNQNKKYPIASTTKLMTALVANELNSDEKIAKVSKRALNTYGENGNFKAGEKIPVKEILYPLLLESSNDAAEIIAENFDRATFLSKMNLQAQKLKMTSTSYNDPSGLSELNVSTASDMFKLSGYLKHKKPEILNITTKRTYGNKVHTWFSNNQFLSEAGYMGGKSGYTNPAKQTVVSLFSIPLGQDSARPIGIVLLQSQDRKTDVKNILAYLKKHIYYNGQADAINNWIAESLALPDIREPDFLTLSFMGDIMLDRGVRSSVNKNFAGDYSALFEKMDVLKKHDIVFANLEGPASDKGKDMQNLYSFRMDPSVIPALKGAGFGVLSLANNHVGDWGREAYIDTLNRLDENEILYVGGGVREKATTPVIIEKYGMKIGYLGFSDVGPNWMETKEDQVGLLLANDPDFEKIIKDASTQVDHLVVSFHWGDEYKTKHNERQEKLAHIAIDNGAKIVVGHHPHVVQDTEVYKNGFIAYSLGNFIFDQKFSAGTMQGMMLELKLGRDGAMSVKKNTVKLNSVFQPDKIIFGKEEKLKFQIPKTQ